MRCAAQGPELRHRDHERCADRAAQPGARACRSRGRLLRARRHGSRATGIACLKENTFAQDNFERGLRLAPDDPDINHYYGAFLCQNGRPEDGIKHFMQAVKNPLYQMPWRSYSAAGQCSLRQNKVKDAEDFFQRALKLDPDEPASLLKLGEIRYRQGKAEEARKLVARHNKLVSPSAESLWLALRIERRLGERVAEASYANQLRRRFPGSPEYALLQRGQYD
jgi:type IV pilus assembly protein PilF